MTSMFDRTSRLFSLQREQGKGRVVLVMPAYMPDVVLTDWLPEREAVLMAFTLRQKVAEFALSQKRSKAKLAELVPIGVAR